MGQREPDGGWSPEIVNEGYVGLPKFKVENKPTNWSQRSQRDRKGKVDGRGT